jgi:hypothetical protein
MDTQESAKNGQSIDGVAFPSPSEIEVAQPPLRKDRLDYIADLTQQLKIVAGQADCHLLADLLEQARLEAVRCLCCRQ